jgi:predicted enzyme related to lactoylglutathione lyase
VGHAVVRFDIGGADDRPLVAFYGELFGWRLRGAADGDYTTIDTQGGGGINGGIGRSPTGEAWSTLCVETDDPQATLDRANSMGGTTVMPVTDLGGAVTMAVFRDLDGLPIGLVREGGGSAPGAGSAEPVTWFEILGSDAARTQQFYAELFGWPVDAAGFPGYAVVDPGTGRGIQGGIGGGVDHSWAIVYAAVADADETLRRAEGLGGSRVSAPGVLSLKDAARAALYGSTGDLSTGMFRDPDGNVFGVYQRH